LERSSQYIVTMWSRVLVLVGVLLGFAGMISAQSSSPAHFLYDISTDPMESNSIYNLNADSDIVSEMNDRIAYWSTQVIDPVLASKTSKTESWTKAGGVVPWVESDFEPVDVEQIYNTDESSDFTPPNIIFVLVDDWGYNDFGKRSTYMPWTTPNVDNLASEGLLFSNYFTHELCTPSRGALMTGKYSLRLGMQQQHELAELPVHEFTMAQEMKSAGYRTYMVGKWHLGISTIQHWPTRRGFDSFYGFVNGDEDYWTKQYGVHLDLQDDESLVTNADEIDSSLHNAYLLQMKAEEMIEDHNRNYSDQPMFMYYAMQLIHSPWSAPQTFVDRCSSPSNYQVTGQAVADDYVADVELNYCAMNLMMDEVIANLTCTLREHDMRENTYLIISGDNGGEGTIPGNAYPYRGQKGSYWRGGVSNTALIHSPMLSNSLRGKVYDGYFHITGNGL
jgi:arylsulfatase A-like enzyme